MPVFDINISNLMQSVFGTRGYQVSFQNGPPASGPLFDPSSVPTIQATPAALQTSLLGTPIYEIITLAAEGKEYTLPNAPLVDILQSKRIEKTYMAGRDGSVKEFIYEDDFVITIRGIIINPDSADLQPIDEIEELYSFFKFNKSLQVDSALLNALGIFNIVVESLELPDVQGAPAIQPFVLNCLSDIPFEIEVTI